MPPDNKQINQTPVAPVVGSATNFDGSNTAAQKTRNPNSTQNTLLLSEVRDNMVIMTDGSFRAVVACQSINFDLMSSREREGVEYSYQNFLNALEYPIQVLIRSQRIDISPYIDHLIEIRSSQDNMLLNVLMDDYISYVETLAEEANIMDKSFFISIPYFPEGDIKNLMEQSKGFFAKLFPKSNTVTKIDTEAYEKAKTEIKNRVDSVMAGLFQIGIKSIQLGTKELGELYYNFYNPDTAVHQPLANFESVTSIYTNKAAEETITGGTNQMGVNNGQ